MDTGAWWRCRECEESKETLREIREHVNRNHYGSAMKLIEPLQEGSLEGIKR